MHTIQSRDNWRHNEIGIYAGLTMDEYLTAPGMSRSDLVRLMDRPSDLQQPRDETSSRVMEFGTLLNDLLLFNTRNYYVRPANYPSTPKATKADPNPITELKPWNGNATFCKEWMQEHADRPVLPGDGDHSAAWLDKCLEAVAAVPLAMELIRHSTPEVSIFAAHEEHPVLLRCRPDLLAIHSDGSADASDIKTTVDATTRGFARELVRFSYDLQAAIVRYNLHRLGISPVRYNIIAIEKGERPRVNVFRVAERVLDRADFALDDALRLYQRCKFSKFWPDFSDHQEVLRSPMTLDLPDHFFGGSVDDLVGATEVDHEPAEASA